VSSDILFFASTFEGFGMPILEAQAIGRVVVTSNILSMPEVGGNAALYVDPYSIEQIRDAICILKNDKILRNSLIDKGFENIKRFNPDTIAFQYEALYQEIIASNNNRSAIIHNCI
jgi:glycosyltransferase involved in cell wall biosynthesis